MDVSNRNIQYPHHLHEELYIEVTTNHHEDIFSSVSVEEDPWFCSQVCIKCLVYGVYQRQNWRTLVYSQ